MIEQERGVFKQTRERLRILDTNLTRRDIDCNIGLMGVIHLDTPGEDIIGKLQDADVVTLELTRRVVEAGLKGEDSNILRRNKFWRVVVDVLRDSNVEMKTVKGVEVNQTPRISWKRFSLHYGVPTIAASYLTVEVERDCLDDFDQLLNEQDLAALRQYNWLITNDFEAYYAVIQRSTEVLHSLNEEEKKYPIALAPGVSLVCSNFSREKSREDREYTLTLITPPHPSLIEAFDSLRQVLAEHGLGEEEAHGLGANIILDYLLSPPQLTEVKEIAYVTNQYIRSLDQRVPKVEVLHIGGANHTPVLSGIFSDYLPKDSRIQIEPSYDQRFTTPASFLYLRSFFRDFIPFGDRMSAVKVVGYETEVQPELICYQVRRTIARHKEEFFARRERYLAEKIKPSS